VRAGHFTAGCAFGQPQKAERFTAQAVQQQARGDLAVVGFLLDQCARGHHQCGADISFRHAVIKILDGLALNQRGIHLGKPFTGFAQQGLQAHEVKRLAAAVFADDRNAKLAGGDFGGGLALAAGGGVRLAVNHVFARDLVFTGAHQRQLDLVLDFFDMQAAAGRHAAAEGRADLCGEGGYRLMHARGSGRRAAFHVQKGFGQGDADFVIGVRHQGAVALDDAKLPGADGSKFKGAGGLCLAGACAVHKKQVL